MKNELSKMVTTNHFPAILRAFNLNVDLTDMVVIKDKNLLIEDVGKMILDEKINDLMNLVKEKKVAFDPETINTYGHVQTLQIGEFLLIKSINN